MSNEKQTAVELFIEQLEEKGDLRETPSIKNIQLNIDTADYIELKIKAKEREKEQAQKYAEFCVMCDRENLPLLDFESYILTYGGNKWATINKRQWSGY